MSILKGQFSSSSNFFIILQFQYTYLFCKYLAHAFSTLEKRIPSKSQLWHFQGLWWKCAKFLMLFSKAQVKSQVFLQILYHSSISWKITLLHFFRPKSIYFEQKESIKMQIFEAFKCSCQNSSRSCHFWNKKLVFLQILSYQSTNLVKFLVSSQNFETLHFDRLLLSKSYTISAKKWHWRVMQS